MVLKLCLRFTGEGGALQAVKGDGEASAEAGAEEEAPGEFGDDGEGRGGFGEGAGSMGHQPSPVRGPRWKSPT